MVKLVDTQRSGRCVRKDMRVQVSPAAPKKFGLQARDVAQLVARVVRDDEVVGSSPAIPTSTDISTLLNVFIILESLRSKKTFNAG